MENVITIQEILKEAGYDVSKYTNRKRTIRSINQVLVNSEIKIKVAPIGKVWTKFNDKPLRHNLRISIPTSEGKVFAKAFDIPNFSDYEMLKCLGLFLGAEKVQSKIKSYVSIPCDCMKCEGKGFIPQFDWYANGVCFDCMGVGITGVLSVELAKKPKKGMAFCRQFYVGKLYDDSIFDNVESIKPISFIDNPTAITYLGKNPQTDVYYIYQPVCRANSWYEIPGDQFEEFSKYFHN